MAKAELIFSQIENFKLKEGEIVLVAFDFGPNSMAENGPQAEVIVEHLMRKRLPFATYSVYPLAQGFLDSIPEKIKNKLEKEAKLNNPDTDEEWLYGRDWVNLGVRAATSSLIIQTIASSDNIAAYLKQDARGNSLLTLQATKNLKTLENIPLFIQFTSLSGTFESYVQFLIRPNYRPIFLHGCTSIMTPQAYIYLDSGQLKGLLEGIAGGAWYSHLLTEKYTQRQVDNAQLINTGLGAAQLLIVLLVLMGNIVAYFSQTRSI
jgi:hypothetical protein